MGKIKDLKKQIETAKAEKITYVRAQEFEKACEARTRERDLMDMLEVARKEKAKKFLTKAKRKEIEGIIMSVYGTINSPGNRAGLGASLSEALGFNFEDITTADAVDNGFVCYRGYDPIRKRVVSITIAPSNASEIFVPLKKKKENGK